MTDQATGIRERYRRAQQLQQGVFTKQVAFNTTLFPHWVGESDCFWYVRDLRGGGSEYRWVDARAGTNELATQAQINEVIQPAEASCPDIHQTVSPDGGRALFSRDHNLWLKGLSSGEEKPLTTDGEAHYVYAAGGFGFDAAADIQTADGAFGITLAIAWLPPVFTLIAMGLIALQPINERRHAIIRKRLDQRMERAAKNSARHQTPGDNQVRAPESSAVTNAS